MNKELSEAQYVEIAAHFAILQNTIPIGVQSSIIDSMELYAVTLGQEDRVRLQDKIFARVNQLANVHADTISRQFRGARNAPSD